MGIIRNHNQLATTPERQKLLDIIESGLMAVHPRSMMESAVRYHKTFNSVTVQNKTYDLLTGRIFVIGGGKAAGYMAEAFERIVGAENITAGIVNCHGGNYRTKKIKVVKAGHPFPDWRGRHGLKKMLALKSKYKIGEKDLVVCLLSGGGSAMLPAPAKGLKLKDTRAITAQLLESGADISEINTVRKHLSQTKGGQLGDFFSPARVAALIVSDETGNDPATIASGPAAPDPTTHKDALFVITKYGLADKAPARVTAHIEGGCRGETAETPKALKNCENFIIGGVRNALEGMAHKTKALGLRPLIASAELAGDTEQAAVGLALKIQAGEYTGYDALFFGGETTPKLPPRHGRGGRNRHFAAAAMRALADINRPYILASIATDGADYLPEAAGAIIDNASFARARAGGLDVEKHIKEYNSAAIFRKMGASQIVTGHTGTNAGDVVAVLFL